MDKRIIYKSESLVIEYEEAYSLLCYRWTEETSLFSCDDFVSEGIKLYNEILKYTPTFIIGDDRDLLFAVSPALQELTVKNSLSTLNTIGVKKYAHIACKELVTRISVEQLFDENQNAGYLDDYFDTEYHAREWILS